MPALQRFLDEAKAMTMVQHEGIVKVFDYGQLPDGVPYILMEYLEGQSLQARLSQATNEGSGLPVSSALEIARQVASAIAALHQKKIVHRDLAGQPDPGAGLADDGRGTVEARLWLGQSDEPASPSNH